MGEESPGADAVRGMLERYRKAKRDVTIRIAESTERIPENVALSLDDYLRLVADVVQASILRERAKWLDALVKIVKAGECQVDPFDQTRGPESPPDAVVKLLCVYARMIDDDLFADAEKYFPQPVWDGKELVFDAGQELLHEWHIRCRGLWIETEHPTSQREACEGGIGRNPVDPSALVPAGMGCGISFSVLDSLLERWLELAFRRVFGRMDAAGEFPAQTAIDEPIQPTDKRPAPPKKAKRSTQRGEGQAKLIAALTKHHKYADGSCLNLEPVGNNELARLAEVAKRTASAFFRKSFDGHDKYRALCNDTPRLVAAIKALNGEFQPRDFYTARTPDEVDRENE